LPANRPLRIHPNAKTSADVVYYNHGNLVMDAAKLSVDWLESATFRKIKGEWKMNFLHSTVRK
jgi:hypothetical protein